MSRENAPPGATDGGFSPGATGYEGGRPPSGRRKTSAAQVLEEHPLGPRRIERGASMTLARSPNDTRCNALNVRRSKLSDTSRRIVSRVTQRRGDDHATGTPVIGVRRVAKANVAQLSYWLALPRSAARTSRTGCRREMGRRREHTRTEPTPLDPRTTARDTETPDPCPRDARTRTRTRAARRIRACPARAAQRVRLAPRLRGQPRPDPRPDAQGSTRSGCECTTRETNRRSPRRARRQ